MSDADDQMGGTGGETGPRPGNGEHPGGKGGGGRPPADQGGERPEETGDRVNEESEQSFPASDPPANY